MMLDDEDVHKKMKVEGKGRVVEGKTYLRQSKWETKNIASSLTPYTAPRNPALTPTIEANSALDLFQKPAADLFSRFQLWLKNNDSKLRFVNGVCDS